MTLSPVNTKIVDAAIANLAKVTADGHVTKDEYGAVADVSGTIYDLIDSTSGDERKHAIEISRSLNLACTVTSSHFEIQDDGEGMRPSNRDGVLDVRRAVAELELLRDDPAATVTADIGTEDHSFNRDAVLKARPELPAQP